MLEGVLADRTLTLRPTTAFVELAALRHNVAAIRARVGPGRQLMAVVKANAYGHGLIRTAQELLAAGADQLGVAFVEEGIALRRAGVQAPILVLGGIAGQQIAHYIEHDLCLTAASPYKLEQIEAVARQLGRRARVHLKVDTGMERIGIHWDNAERLIRASLEVEHVDVAGIFSHLASADSPDPAHTQRQRARFEQVLGLYAARGVQPPLRHLANSGAILQHPDCFYDMVRPGALLYGFSPSCELPLGLDLRPALTLATRVVYFKVVRAGDPVSYGGLWAPPEDTRVVTLPIGYGDGYHRPLTGKARVLIGGRPCPVVGAITMDAMMADIGQGSAYNGDEAVLIGAQGDARITVEDLAAPLGTVPYEILTSISARVPRVYLEEGETRDSVRDGAG